MNLGVTAGITAVFLVSAAFEYFESGPFAFDISDKFARHLSLL